MIRHLGPIGVFLAAIAANSPTFAAEIGSHLTDRGTPVITLSGEIENGDARKFKSEASKYDSAVVVLESDGGKTMEAIEIGEALHLKGFSTLVFNGSQCTSSCGLIWLAGTPRALSRSARIGFHAAYTSEGGRNLESGVGNAVVGRYFTLLDLPLSAVVFATVASPDTINWLDRTNLSEVGIPAEVVDDLDFDGDAGAGNSGAADGAEIVATRDFEWRSGPWTVLSTINRSGCFALLEFDTERGLTNTSALSIAKYRNKSQAYFSLRNDKFRSVAEGHDYRLQIVFKTGDSLDTGWGEHSFTGVEYESGQHGLTTKLDWEALSEDVRREDTVAFLLGDKIVDTFPLKGSAAAMQQLDRCLRENLESRVADPFE